MQIKLLPKSKDLGIFAVPCIIGNVTIGNALCDLGENISHALVHEE